MMKSEPAVYLEPDDSGEIEIVLVKQKGEEQRFPRTMPERDLIQVVELDYSAYRNEVRRLREEHPLFEDRLDVSAADYEDLTAQVMCLAETLRKLDSVARFVIVSRLDAIFRIPNDGRASFLLDNGELQLRALEEPIRTQLRLHNIFDVTFDEMGRATQRKQYEKLHTTYP